MPAYGRAGRQTGHCGRGMASCDFRAQKNKQTKTKAASPSSQASWMNLPAFIYFLITNRDETRLPPDSPSLTPSSVATATAAPLLIHIPLSAGCCCAKHLTPKVSKTTLALLTRLLAANLPVHSLPLCLLYPPLQPLLVSGNLLKNIKKPAPRVNEKRIRRGEAR